MKKLLTLLTLIFCCYSQAEIFKCTNKNGDITYSDKECNSKAASREIVSGDLALRPFDTKIELEEIDLKTVYEGSRLGKESRFLRVSVYEETDSYMIFFVEGYYKKSYQGKAEFRVFPNIRWAVRSFSTTDEGVVSGYARVGLGSKSENEVDSDIITLQLWEYIDGKTHKILETRIIPFKKKWIKKQ